MVTENQKVKQLVWQVLEFWSREWELNPRPADYESAALPLSYLGPFLISHSSTDFSSLSLDGTFDFDA
jgi:hypothetical protein